MEHLQDHGPELSPTPSVERAADKLGALLDSSSDAEILEAMVDQLDEAVFVVDRDQHILLFNKRAEELTGFDRDQVLGRHCLRGIRCAHCLETCGVFEKKQIHDVPLQVFRSDGTELEVLKSGSVIRDAEGNEIGAVEVMRRRPEPTPEPPPDRRDIDLLMESMGRAFIELDADFHILRASSSVTELTDQPADQLTGRSAAALLGDDLFAPGSPFRAALLAGERREGWRASITDHEDNVRLLSVSGAPLATKDLAPQTPGSDHLTLAPQTPGPDNRISPRAQTQRYVIIIRPENDGVDDRGRPSDAVEFEGMVARSPAMRRVFHMIDHLHDNDAAVLITGASGTGKELVARAIHARSVRANQPFVAVNCGALPGDLLESELFGHARGAFTGAVRDKAGRFELASDGTIFLDEIGDLPLPLQVKLLRVLQERTFERVGETKSRAFRARVVAATNQDLVDLVLHKRFRQDLFYRLNVVPIALPPLRDRREDLDLLIHHLLGRIGRRRSRAQRLSPGAMRTLLSYDWPGNVRQLENALEYATAVCEGQTIHREDLPPELLGLAAPAVAAPAPPEPAPAPVATPAPEEIAAAAGKYPSASEIVNALAQCRQRRGQAARLLGVSRTTLWRRMREEGLTGG